MLLHFNVNTLITKIDLEREIIQYLLEVDDKKDKFLQDKFYPKYPVISGL